MSEDSDFDFDQAMEASWIEAKKLYVADGIDPETALAEAVAICEETMFPALAQLQKDAKTWVPPETPDDGVRVEDMTEEQVSEAFNKIMRNRGYNGY
jgi:hypothetical protein